MKLLAADVGNTNITLGLFTDGELVGSWRATAHAGATPDEIAAMTAEMLALDGHRLDELRGGRARLGGPAADRAPSSASSAPASASSRSSSTPRRWPAR